MSASVTLTKTAPPHAGAGAPALLPTASWTAQDARVDWSGLFAAAAHANAAQVAPRTVRRTVGGAGSVALGMKMVRTAVLFLIVLAGAKMLSAATLSTFASSSSDASAAGARAVETITQLSNLLLAAGSAGVLVMFAVAALLIMAGGSATRTITEQVAGDPTLQVPAPVSYHARVEVDDHGMMQAIVTRRAPQLTDSTLTDGEREIGRVALGSGEETAESASRFHALVAELEQLEEQAAGPYRQLLVEHGMDAAQRTETEAALRVQAEQAMQRRQLNAPVADALNRYASERAEQLQSV